MNSLLKVSVFIPNYNYARYLPRCLDSILSQTYQDFEIVIVDDGSTDNSHEVLMEYQGRYPQKIHYYWHPGHANKGVTASSNLAISKSRGEYLAWTGSDDEWYPDKLALQVEQLDRDTALGMTYSYADYIDADGRLLTGRAGTDITSDSNPVGSILRFCHPPAMTTVIRRNCLQDVGLVDEKLRACEDWDLWIRIFSRWKVGFIEQSLAKYRIHGGNLSKKIDPRVDLYRILAMYENLEHKMDEVGGALIEPRNQAIFNLQFCFHLFSDNNLSEAVRRLNLAFDIDPSLCVDIAFITDWLNQWKPDFYTSEHSHFGLWFIEHLPPSVTAIGQRQLLDLQLQNQETRVFFIQRGVLQGEANSEPVTMDWIFRDCPNELPIPNSWKEDVLKEVYPKLLFGSYKTGNLPNTRYYWKKTVQLDPSWLTNRGVLSIGLKVFSANRR
jgi:glycosyltransferase involved in cell wall biosynthesis